jgi:hypothetical protein
MSDSSQRYGWWLASDGRWYPPESWTGPATGPAQPLPYGTNRQPVSQGTQWGAGPPITSWTAVPPRDNGLAVASLVCACAGFVPFLFGLPSIVAIILGFAARTQIRASRGTQGGAGLALAGIIVGFCVIGLGFLLILEFANPSPIA